MRLPTKDSATWRGILTSAQVLGAFIVALVATPDAMELIRQFYPQFIPVLTGAAGVIAFVIGFFRKSVKNY